MLMDTDSFIVYIKTDDLYRDIAEDFETNFEILNYELEFHWNAVTKRKKWKSNWIDERLIRTKSKNLQLLNRW